MAAVRSLARRRALPLAELLGEELAALLHRAERERTVTVLAAERLCDEILGWHPRMVWADTYDHTIRPRRHTVTARRGSRSGYRQGCRCDACSTVEADAKRAWRHRHQAITRKGAS